MNLEDLQEFEKRCEEEHLARMEEFNENLEEYREELHAVIWGPKD